MACPCSLRCTHRMAVKVSGDDKRLSASRTGKSGCVPGDTFQTQPDDRLAQFLVGGVFEGAHLMAQMPEALQEIIDYDAGSVSHASPVALARAASAAA